MSAQRQQGAARRAARTWVVPYVRQYARALAVALALGIATFAFATGLMATSGYLVAGAATTSSILLLEIPLILVRVFGVGKPLLQYAERLASHDWVLKMTSGMRRGLWRALATDGGGKLRSGEVLGLLADDVEHLQNLYLRVAFPTVIAWVLFAALVGICGAMSAWLATAIALLVGAELTVVPLISLLAERARAERAAALETELFDAIADDVEGVGDWVCSGRKDDFASHHTDIQSELRRLRAKSDAFARARDFAVQVLMGLVVVVLVVWAGDAFGTAAGGTAGAGAASGTGGGAGFWGDANWIAAFALAFFPLIEAFAPVPQAAVDSLAHRTSLEHLSAVGGPRTSSSAEEDGASTEDDIHQAYETTPTRDGIRQVYETTPARDGMHQAYETMQATGERSPGNPTAGRPIPGRDVCQKDATDRKTIPDISLSHVSFAYELGRTILDDVTLEIPGGTTLAVLGRSGAGKSTLLSLIRGNLAPTAGSVTINGTDATELRGEMHRIAGVIAQDSHIFNMSLFDNVRLAREDATRDEVEAALTAVGLDGLVARLERGIDTIVDESAATFSGGEAQRIALARVLLADTPIVLLDEPFVSLDPACESAIARTLARVLAGRTTIMVTHHLAGVSHADDVVFLGDGTIELHGSPAELEATNGKYRSLIALEQ